jgi:DnaK suppressor protein
MWMTREEIASALGIVPNSVRGKVQKGQIERKIEDGKNLYRAVSATPFVPRPASTESPSPPEEEIANKPPVLEPVPRPKPEAVSPPVEKPPAIMIHTAPPPVSPPVFRPFEERPVTERPPIPEKLIEDLKKPVAERSKAFNAKQVLLEALASLRIGRSIEAIEKGDEIDLATGEISRELDARISMRQHKQLKEIEDALERLKLGEYGNCEDCGEPIPEQRLRLFPAARLCVRCQEEFDQYEKMKEDQAMRGGSWRDDTSDSGYSRSFED